MKVYSPAEIADLLKLKVSTIRKYSIMLEQLGYEFEKNSRNQRYYTDADVITLRKLVTFKNNGMTLEESAEAVVLWHNGNESDQDDITPYQTVTQDAGRRDDDDIQELKNMIQQLSDKVDEQSEQLRQQQEYINTRLEQRDQALLQSIEERLETRRQIAAETDQQEKKPGFFARLFKTGDPND